MAIEPNFAFENNNSLVPAPGNIITGSHLYYLLGLLCSKTYYFALRKYYMGGGIEGELKTNRLLLLPIPTISNFNSVDILEQLVQKRIKGENVDNAIEDIIYKFLNFTQEEIDCIDNMLSVL
ncbi:MAG: hypothetical protein IJ180_10095 [Bacteroidales bacterium]|nr:hypothetical protein [Bacteroidales bacterium]